MTADRIPQRRAWSSLDLGHAALAGGAAWVCALIVARPQPFDTSWAYALLMFAPLVVVPLTLRLVVADDVSAGEKWLRRSAAIIQLPAALLLGSAFLLPPGLSAGALAAPWLGTTGLLS